jgi:hypothetical protein
MEITYRLSENDLPALADDLTSRSPTARRLLRRGSFVAFFTMALTALLCWLLTGEPVIAGGVILIGVILAALMPARLKKNQRRVTAAVYREGRNRALFLPTTLGIDRDSLTWHSDAGSGNLKYEYLERVRHTETHLFIYTTIRNAYIVPRDGVISGDFDSFAWEIERRWRNATDGLAEPHELDAAWAHHP